MHSINTSPISVYSVAAKMKEPEKNIIGLHIISNKSY